MTMKQFLALSLIATFAFAHASPLQAGKITAWAWDPTGIASVALAGVPPLADPNNDDVSGISPNVLLVTQKAYFAVGPVDIEFTVMDSGGTTEYTIIEGVDNGTGIPWSAYRIELGFGLGSSFVPSPAGDGLDFDALDYNSPPLFTGSGYFLDFSQDEDELEAFDGVFPVGGFSHGRAAHSQGRPQVSKPAISQQLLQ